MARVLLAVLALMMTMQVQAQSPERALLPVVVNETDRGEVFAYVAASDVFIARTFLEELQIPLEQALVETFDDEPFVSLQSLAPRIQYSIDPADLVLKLMIDPVLLGNRVLELRGRNVVADRGGDPSVFLNYGILGDSTDVPAVAFELGANRGHRSASSGFSRTAEGDFLRGLSYFAIESPRDLRRLTIGDAFVGSDALGGTVTMGGVTLSRQFSLQPYFIRTPALDLQGTAATPSVVEVYVNGQLMNRVSVDPGVFTLQNLPVTSGLGNATIVVRDAFGRETVQHESFYYSSLALRRGLSDFVFSAGSLRESFTESFDYGDAAGLAHYRRGVTDRLTLGGRAEGSEAMVSGGPSFTYGSPVGDFDLALAASSSGGESGYAGAFTYRFSAPRFSLGLSAIGRSDRYATLSLPVESDRGVVDVSGFGAMNFRYFNVALTASRNELRDSQAFDRVALQATATLGRGATVFTSLGASRQGDGEAQPEIAVGLTFGFGRDTANLQFQRSLGQETTIAQIRRPLGLANGFGYSISADSATERALAILDYQTSFGRYQVVADPQDLENTSYNIAGGLVYLGGRLTPARPVDESYALARVGVPDVELFASNQSVGRTGPTGDLLIPNLLPHYANQLRINDRNVPIDYEVLSTEVTVVPPTRGGVVANFPVRRLRSYSGRIVFLIIGEPYTPGLGEMVVTRGGEEVKYLLGRDGEFYVDDLDPGKYEARLRIGKVDCTFPLILPETTDALTDLGEVRCQK